MSEKCHEPSVSVSPAENNCTQHHGGPLKERYFKRARAEAGNRVPCRAGLEYVLCPGQDINMHVTAWVFQKTAQSA